MTPTIAVVDYGMGNRRSVEKALERVGARAFVSRDHTELQAADGLLLPGVGAFPAAMAVIRELGLDELLRGVAAAGTPLFGSCMGMQLLFERSAEHGGAEGLGLLRGEVRGLPGGRRPPADLPPAEPRPADLPPAEPRPADLPTAAPRPAAPRPADLPPAEPRPADLPTAAPRPAAPRPADGGSPLLLKLPHIGWSEVRWRRRTALNDGLPDPAFLYHVHSFVAYPADPEVVLGTAEYGEIFPAVVEQGNIFGAQSHPEKSSTHGLRLLGNFVGICAAAAAARMPTTQRAHSPKGGVGLCAPS
jgi:glutamine amidotransferase